MSTLRTLIISAALLLVSTMAFAGTDGPQKVRTRHIVYGEYELSNNSSFALAVASNNYLNRYMRLQPYFGIQYRGERTYDLQGSTTGETYTIGAGINGFNGGIDLQFGHKFGIVRPYALAGPRLGWNTVSAFKIPSEDISVGDMGFWERFGIGANVGVGAFISEKFMIQAKYCYYFSPYDLAQVKHAALFSVGYSF